MQPKFITAKDYRRRGFYAYAFDFQSPESFFATLRQSVQTTLEGDLPSVHPNLTGASVKRIRRLLAAIATNVPMTPDLSKLRPSAPHR